LALFGQRSPYSGHPHILTEACNPAVNISISSPTNTPEMMEKISGLLQSFMLAQTQLLSKNSSLSTPITRITTPTLRLSTDGTTNFTPTLTSPPQIMFKDPDGTTQLSRPLDENPFAVVSDNNPTDNQSALGALPPTVPEPSPPRESSAQNQAPTKTAPSQPTEPPNLQPAPHHQAFFQGRPVNVNFTPPTSLRTAVTSSFVPPNATAPSASSSETSDAPDTNQTDAPAWDTNDRDAHSIAGVSPDAVKTKKKKKK
jgi:hypothetical protein